LCALDNLVELVEAIRSAYRHPLFGVGRVGPESWLRFWFACQLAAMPNYFNGD
jgi:hypothetical protein